MATTLGSVDAAANGFLRHRFARALSASLLAVAVFGWIAVMLGGSVYDLRVGARSPGHAALNVAVALLLPLLAIAIPIALIQRVHRRIIAIVLLALSFPPMLFFGAILGWTSFFLLNLPIPARVAGVLGPYPSWFLTAFAAFLILSLIVLMEMLLQAWWQLTIGARDFRAVRGWRPPVHHLLSTFRREIGLPAFLANMGSGRFGLAALYFGVSVLNAVIVLLLLLPLIALREPGSTFNISLVVPSIVIVCLLALNLAGVGRFLARAADARATTLYQGVREWDARAPVIFLRAFTQDDDKVKAVALDPFVKLPAGVGAARSLDEILLEHASPYGPVIAIGDPRDPTPPLGAARIFVKGSGNEWQDVVRDLVAAAKSVVICPAASAGTRWELDLVDRADLKAKTIYLANPELVRDGIVALFATLGPDLSGLKHSQTPIAAFMTHSDGWIVLTARRRSVQSYTVALNMALYTLFGAQGVTLGRRKRAVSSSANASAPSGGEVGDHAA